MHIVLKLSKLCNLRCVYCYEYEELAQRQRMSLDGLDRFFSSIADWWSRGARREEIVFVFHGGEPLLLPDQYLQEVVAAQRRHLEPVGVAYHSSIQTNLTSLRRERIDVLEQLGVSLGVSLDVFGGQRVGLNGLDSQQRALKNLQLLIDEDGLRRLRVGAIAVLHARNAASVRQIHEFYRRLGISYRLLPVFSLTEVPSRMADLPLDASEVLAAYRTIAETQLRDGIDGITVYPLYNFFVSAVLKVSGIEVGPYDPMQSEWALIVDTNGDVFNHSEAYTQAGLLGNVFEDEFSSIMSGDARRAMAALRHERGRSCEECRYALQCSRIPVMEALPSERAQRDDGRYDCLVARPMIEFYERALRADQSLMDLVERRDDTVSATVEPGL